MELISNLSKSKDLNKLVWQLISHNPIFLVGGIWLSIIASGAVAWNKLTDPGKETGAYPPLPHSVLPTKLAEPEPVEPASPVWGLGTLMFGSFVASLLMQKSQKKNHRSFPISKPKPLPKPSAQHLQNKGIPPFVPQIPSFANGVTLPPKTETQEIILPPKLSVS
ncbi:MAG: hypothetical protein DSM107014_14685 [Gomphosphaeria aponina SAG 52.96 = DSM 107014]|uniref:Uncharacterized protein n=1 Tax=Gomphosphaeria aponina SAG 52.96 = DSM 107014 TaxID=1521640 RepID=A0A941GRN7_9CHRO|nr:hypothetical protein [Gomphosphaeria aponina SAG 52.96 = DSM 107014]